VPTALSIIAISISALTFVWTSSTGLATATGGTVSASSFVAKPRWPYHTDNQWDPGTPERWGQDTESNWAVTAGNRWPYHTDSDWDNN